MNAATPGAAERVFALFLGLEKQARQAAIELLTKIKSSAEHIDALLDKKLAWNSDERISFVNNLRTAANRWKTASAALP